jgi:Grx4 family monothiol glutaredoxin
MVTSKMVLDVSTEQDFASEVAGTSSNTVVVAHFWAEWCEPCKQMDEVLRVIAEDPKLDGRLKILRVEAEKEELEDVTEKYDVSMVPHFVFLRSGKVVDTLEGADPQGLNQKVTSLLESLPSAGAAAAEETKNQDVAKMAAEAAKSEKDEKRDLNARLEKLIKSDNIVLFMKGSPSEPRCGFSKKAVAMLHSLNAKFGHFDILTDQSVRQGLKEYSNWPTYPQLYSKGELLGGFDIMEEMMENGELKSMVEEAIGSGSEEEDLNTRLGKLVNSSKVMLFMKGDREEPRCGFSARVAKAMTATGVEYKTFDILEDQEVRQGLKEYSNWPTYPQLYVQGELIGGCDIIMELAETGELAAELGAAA